MPPHDQAGDRSGAAAPRPETTVDAIFRRAGAEPATLADLEAEYGPVGEG